MASHAKPLLLHLLGDTALLCNGAPRPLPKSRKTRALLAFLAMQARPVRREALCDLLWESAADPRAALRWSLSKLRPLLETPSGQALQADAHWITLDSTRHGLRLMFSRPRRCWQARWGA
jgi:DNA-binding SARP family transcriptional activator